MHGSEIVLLIHKRSITRKLKYEQKAKINSLTHRKLSDRNANQQLFAHFKHFKIDSSLSDWSLSPLAIKYLYCVSVFLSSVIFYSWRWPLRSKRLSIVFFVIFAIKNCWWTSQSVFLPGILVGILSGSFLCWNIMYNVFLMFIATMHSLSTSYPLVRYLH